MAIFSSDAALCGPAENGDVAQSHLSERPFVFLHMSGEGARANSHWNGTNHTLDHAGSGTVAPRVIVDKTYITRFSCGTDPNSEHDIPARSPLHFEVTAGIKGVIVIGSSERSPREFIHHPLIRPRTCSISLHELFLMNILLARSPRPSLPSASRARIQDKISWLPRCRVTKQMKVVRNDCLYLRKSSMMIAWRE
jgi:hypothetical protein